MTPYQSDHAESSTNDSIKSAKSVVPFIMELIHPKRVVDVGCGLGGWLSVFSTCGVDEVFGIDGDYVDTEKLCIPVEYFMAHDLTKPFNNLTTFDLAVSLEVAEHLPSECASLFIDQLVNLAPAVLFSAAVPYQPGDFHINCQWPEYWANLFYQKNYVLFDCLRMKFWDDKNVKWWYSQNMLLFINLSCLGNYPALETFSYFIGSPPISIVHPELYNFQQGMYNDLKEASNPIKSVLRRLIKKLIKIQK